MLIRHLAFATLLAAAMPAQTLQLARKGGAIGQNLDVRVSGIPNRPFLLLPSLNAGPTPLRILDARDTRSLEAGLDLLALVIVGTTQATPVTLRYPIPNFASLAGQTLHFQAFSFPGSNLLVDQLSNPIRQTLGQSNTWLNRGSVLNAARALAQTVALDNGRMLLTGGGSGTILSARGLRSTEIYDADRQRFVAGPNMGSERALHRAVRLNNGKVLVVGGVNSMGNPLNSCELYDPATNTFSATGALRVARAGHTVDLLPNGNVLVAGGTTNLTDALQAINNTQRSTEIYNTAAGTWSNGPNLSRPRLAHASIRLGNGRVLITGGATFTTIFIKIPGITNTCEVYDPTTNRFSGTGSIPGSRAAHDLVALANGQVLASGGAQLASITSINAISSAATYDPNSGRWTSTANNMRIARATHTTVRLPNGRVLVIGGATGSLTAPVSTALCDFYDPATRRFTAAASLNAGRAAPTALLLAECQVFVAGGGGANNATLNTGEMFFQ